MLTLCTEVDLDRQIETVAMCVTDEVHLDAFLRSRGEAGHSDVVHPVSIDVTTGTTQCPDALRPLGILPFHRLIKAGTSRGDNRLCP